MKATAAAPLYVVHDPEPKYSFRGVVSNLVDMTVCRYDWDLGQWVDTGFVRVKFVISPTGEMA